MRARRLRHVAGIHYGNHGRSEFNIPGITFGTRYDNSPIIVADGTSPPPDQANAYEPTACPGGRAPHLWFDQEAAKPISLYDQFGFEFTLLKLDGCREQEWTPCRMPQQTSKSPQHGVSPGRGSARSIWGRSCPDQAGSNCCLAGEYL